MSLLEAANEVDSQVEQQKSADADANEKHAMRENYFETVSGYAHTFAKNTKERASTLGGAIKRDVPALAWSQLTGGPGGAYARSAMGETTPETTPGMYEQAPAPLRAGGKLTEAIWGAGEWAGWGAITGGLGRAMTPLTKWLPEELTPVVKQAIINGGLSGGATAVTNEIERKPPQRDLPTSMAIGALIGGVVGMMGPEDMQAIQQNFPQIRTAAGGDTFSAGVNELSNIANVMGKSEGIAPKEMMQRLGRFAAGQQDESLAAGIRIHQAANPSMYKTPLMKRIADHAKDTSKPPPIRVPKAGELHNFFTMPPLTGETVISKGAPGASERGPLGIPLKSDHPNEAAKPDVTEDLSRVVADKGPKFKPETIASSRKLSALAMNGILRPEHVTDGKQAYAVSRGLMRIYQEHKTAAGEAGKSGAPRMQQAMAHFDMGKEWMRRYRALGEEPELPSTVKAADLVDMTELSEKLHKGQPRQLSEGGPVKRPIKEAVAKVKRDAKGRFC